jgi:hypothetical protein
MTYDDYRVGQRIMARAREGTPGVRETHQGEMPAVQRCVALGKCAVSPDPRGDADARGQRGRQAKRAAVH